jgi:hypothetical protein
MVTVRICPGGTLAEHQLGGAVRRRLHRLASSAAWLANPAAWPLRSGTTVPGWAIASAALSPVLLVGGYLVAGALQPASYTPIKETVSVLAGHGGTDRWIMTGALFLVGGCYLLTAAGMTTLRVPARILLVVAGLSSIGIATSPEPARGSSSQHLAWVVVGAITIAVWPAFAARGTAFRPVILNRCAATVVTAVFIGLLGWLMAETQDGSVLGLAERLTSSVQVTWPFVVAVMLRHGRTVQAPVPSAVPPAAPSAVPPAVPPAAPTAVPPAAPSAALARAEPQPERPELHRLAK